MRNKKLKKVICGLAVCLCAMGAAAPTFAQTVDFNITVPGDILSKRANKADDEQKFYVTGTSFSKSGFLNCTSIRLDAPSVRSNVTSISKTRVSSSATYLSYAKPGCDYYMTTTATASGLNVKGRYTP